MLIQLFSFKCTVITNISDNKATKMCNLDPALIAEIASYKRMIEYIMNQITQNWGMKLFAQ